MRRVWTIAPRAAVALLVMSLGACSYDLSSLPSSCRNTADCTGGRTCYEGFCVVGGPLVGGPPSDGGGIMRTDGGSDGVHADAATGASNGGTGGTGSPSDGGGGSGSATDASGPGSDAGGDGATPDAGAQLPPYAACVSSDDCNAGETCRKSGTRGVCSAPCTSSTECTMPAGSYGATAACDGNGTCRLDCGPVGIPPFARDCPAGMTCLLELGSNSCYPN